jgi:hypothetical protein
MTEVHMSVGIVFLIILMVPLLFQVLKLASESRRRHADLLERIIRMENRLDELENKTINK